MVGEYQADAFVITLLYPEIEVYEILSCGPRQCAAESCLSTGHVTHYENRTMRIGIIFHFQSIFLPTPHTTITTATIMTAGKELSVAYNFGCRTRVISA